MIQLPTIPRIELLPLKAALPAGQDSELTVLVRIHPHPVQMIHHGPRPPLNLALVIDRSGSMSGKPLQMARKAAQVAVRQLQGQDRVSVVTFDDTVDTLIPSQPVTDQEALCRRIEQISEGGMTALHAGWLDGALQVAQHQQPQALNRVLLLSDGQANRGLTDQQQIAQQVSGLRERGVGTTTIGLGSDYDEDLLRRMAEAGDGNYEHIEDAEQLPDFFQAELGGLSRTSGHSVALGIEPSPILGSLRQTVLNDLQRNSAGQWQLRNLIEGQPIEVVYILHIPAQPEQSEPTLLQAQLTWTGRDGIRHALHRELRLPVLSADACAALPEQEDVRVALELQRNAQAKRDAMQQLDQGNIAAAQAILRGRGAVLAAAPMSAAKKAAEQAELLDLEEQVVQNQLLARKRAISQNFNMSNSKMKR